MDRQRYLRQAQVPGLDPDILAARRIVVVGAGAVGNEVVKNLALMGVGRIELIDFDRVELHNLTRSIFLRESDVGQPKAAALAARAAEVDPNVCIHAHHGDAWRLLGLSSLSGCDALIAAVDSIEARMRLSQLCLLAGVDFINCGIDARHVVVERFPFSANALPACYECHLPDSAYRRVAERYSCGWLRRALEVQRSVPTTAITASIAGALAVQQALRVGGMGGAGGMANTEACRTLIDTRSGTSTVSRLARSPDCAACAELATRPRRVAASAHGWAAAVARAAPGATWLRLSDALVTDHECHACGDRHMAAQVVGRRADDFDDSLMRCSACGKLAVHVHIQAEAMLSDLQRCLADRPMPVKYLLAPTDGGFVCIDLEDPSWQKN
jgi:molybdopterin/thiamine biosynthesis adenylyltransferase